jgi:hypothetical protein
LLGALRPKKAWAFIVLRGGAMFAERNQLTHLANVKVGRVKGNSRVYPQLRLPSKYADLVSKKAGVYEMNCVKRTLFLLSASAPRTV